MFGNRTARKGGFKLLPLLLFGGYFVWYWFSNQTAVPLTGRAQLVDISRDQEMSLGLQAFRQALSQERVVERGPAADQVRQIATRLIAAVRTLDAKADPGFQWEVALIDSPQANAFALPGGKLAVYTGILPITANVDGLAAVMGHEIAHAVARHGAERMAHQKLVQMGSMAAGMSVSDMDPGMRGTVMAALGAGARFGVLLPFSRDHESEADYLGLMFAAAACFDPREAPRLWERMGQASKGQPPEFASTHPSHETRIRRLNDWMPEALALRAQHCSESALPAERRSAN